jgi:hypothetical protein
MQQPGADARIMQLYKRYREPISQRFKDRKITRPRAVNGADFRQRRIRQPVCNYTVNEQTGIVITFLSTRTAANLSWTGLFYVPVHFLDDSIEWHLEIAGPADSRFLAGPSVVLQEVRE